MTRRTILTPTSKTNVQLREKSSAKMKFQRRRLWTNRIEIENRQKSTRWRNFRMRACLVLFAWPELFLCIALLLNITDWGKMRGVHIWDMIMTHGMGLFWLLRIMKWMMIMWRLPILDLSLSLSCSVSPPVFIHISQARSETSQKRGGKKLIVQFIKRNLGLSYALLDSTATFILFRYLCIFFSVIHEIKDERRKGRRKAQHRSRWNDETSCSLMVNSSTARRLNGRTTHTHSWLDRSPVDPSSRVKAQEEEEEANWKLINTI